MMSLITLPPGPMTSLMRETGMRMVVIFGASGDLTRRKIIPALGDLSRDGEQIRLIGAGRSDLSDEEQAYFERCYAAYREGAGWVALSRLVDGPANPLLGSTNGRITAAVWEHPLFQAARDLESRAGIADGSLERSPEHDPSHEPLDDAWLRLPAAAREKGVSPTGLHHAIERGEVLARPARRGGSWLLVSRNSLTRWRPNPRRQAASRGRIARGTAR